MAKPDKPNQGKALNNLRRMSGATDGPLSERRGPSRPKSRAGRAGSGDALMSWREFFKTFWRIAGPDWGSEEKHKVRLLTLALVVLTICQVGVPVAINRWMRWLFDALEQKAMHQFAELSWILLLILVSNVAIVNLHLRVKRRIQIGWRAWLAHRIEQ